MRITKTVVGRILLLVLLGFTVCALTQTQVLEAKQPVTRPFHIEGQITYLDIMGGPPYSMIDEGSSSNLGKFVDVGKYDQFGPDHGIGIVFAADGDQIFWEDIGGGVIVFTGGTGRFKGVTGGFNFTVSPLVFVPGPSGTISVVFTYMGEGTITY
jgi:hypothetical protein